MEIIVCGLRLNEARTGVENLGHAAVLGDRGLRSEASG